MEIEEDEEESEEEGETSYLPLEEGEMIMIKRILHTTEVPSEANQRMQIFLFRFKVDNKTCNLIIDGVSYTNVAFTEMVNKLNLDIIEHPRSYTLQ